MTKLQVPELTGDQLCWGVVGTFGGMFIHLVIGSLYQWGIINIYITSYFKLKDDSVTLQQNAIAFPIMMLCIGIMMRLGLFLCEKTHPIFILTINVTLQALFIFVSSYVNEMTSFIVLYGVMFGLVSGLNFMIPIVECNKFVPGRKMYINGVILIGTGLGSVVFGLFSYNFLNPNRVTPNQGLYIGTQQRNQISNKVPECLRFLSLLYLIIGYIGIALISKACIQNRRNQNLKKQEGTMQDNNEKNNEKKYEEQDSQNQFLQIALDVGEAYEKKMKMKKQAEAKLQNQTEGKVQNNDNKKKQQVLHQGEAKSFKEVFCSKICWVQAFVIFCGSCGVFLVNGNYKTYVKEDISDDEFLTIIGVIGSVGNGGSRFFWNLLFNHTGYKTVMALNLFIQITVYATIRFTVQDQGVYLFMVFLINCCLGGLLVMAPTVSQIIFGQKIGSDIYGFYWTIFALSNFLQYIFVSNLSNSFGFNNIIYVILGMTVLSLIMILLYRFEGPWKNHMEHLGFCAFLQK